MVTLKDHSRDNQKASHFSLSEFGNFAYSCKSDLDDWVELLDVYGIDNTKGEIEDLQHELVTWKLEEATERRGK